MQVFYGGTGRRKLASVQAAFVSRLSQVDRFSSYSTTEVRNLRHFLQQAMLVLLLRVAIGLREDEHRDYWRRAKYNRCKQGAGKPGGHRPPWSQSKRSDMQRRLNHSHQSLGLNMSSEVAEGVVGEFNRSSNSTAGESE